MMDTAVGFVCSALLCSELGTGQKVAMNVPLKPASSDLTIAQFWVMVSDHVSVNRRAL